MKARTFHDTQALIPADVAEVGEDDASSEGCELNPSDLKVRIRGLPQPAAEEERDDDASDTVKVEKVLVRREFRQLVWEGGAGEDERRGRGLLRRCSRRDRAN